VNSRSLVIEDNGDWIYLLRNQDLWALRGDDFSVQSEFTFPESSPSSLALSPDNRTLYLFTDQLMALDTAELQNLGIVPTRSFPEDLFNLDYGIHTQPRLYLSPEIDVDSVAFVRIEYGELYRSTDMGKSWFNLPSSIYPDFKYIYTLSLSPDFADDQTLVAFRKTLGAAIYRSTNQGDIWEAWSPPIAFVSDRDGNREIYTMNQEGGNLQRLTYHSASDEHPAWSPAWTRLAFQSNRNGNWDIFTMRLDCDPAHPEAENLCDLQQLTDSPADETWPAWSPDGGSIAYTSTQDGNPEIYLMDKNGQNSRRLTFSPSVDQQPVWQTDSQHLFFVSYRRGNNDIYRLTVPPPISLTLAAELELTAIITHAANDQNPTATEGGLFFVSDRDGLANIYRVDQYSTKVVRDTDYPMEYPAASDYIYHKILVTINQEGITNIYLIPGLDSITQPLAALTQSPSFDGHPAWGPVVWLPDTSASREWIRAHKY
jgi:WD40 repeat protein